MALVVVAVLVGNAFPIVEMPRAPDGYLGKTMVGKADTHLAVVTWGKDPYDASGAHASVPADPARWAELEARNDLYTEIVCNDDSQVLPLGYMMVRRAEDEGRRMENGGRRTEDGGRGTEDGGRRSEDGGRRTEDGGRRTEDGGRRRDD